MKTIRRLIYREVLITTGFVLLAFLSLFFFFDFVEELGSLGKPSRLQPEVVYEVRHALAYVALLMPNRIYELMPISVLIGSIAVLARFAQTSEYTILRTSGLGPWKALRTLLGLGMLFVALTFAVGDYVAPLADKTAQLLKARYQGRISLGQTGAWLKEKQAHSNFAVNVGSLSPRGTLGEVRIFEFNNEGSLVSTTEAESGQIGADETWTLTSVQRRLFESPNKQSARIVRSEPSEYQWPSAISAEMVSVALLKPERMRTTDLYAYIQHLDANGQIATVRNRVLAQGVLPLELPGDGGARPALCLSELPFRQHHRLRVWRGDDRHQLLLAQQRVRLHRQPQPMATLARCGIPGHDLLRVFARGVWLAGSQEVM